MKPRNRPTRTNRLFVHLTDAEMAKLDQMRGSVARSAYVRSLLTNSGRAGVADTAEALRLLSESARAGSIQAQIALERALRAAGPEPEGDLLDELARRRGVA